ncbi:hypothetical protein M3Y96_00310900 [Aphelenchoides besseyi]|nr:hypothetical protein M3Y96_00310900 [Aphelenchoides besseyi]
MNPTSYQSQGPPQGYPQDSYQLPASSPAPPPEISTGYADHSSTSTSETVTESSSPTASSTVSSSTSPTSTVSGFTDSTTTNPQSTSASTLTEQSTTTEATSSPDTSKVPKSTKKNPDEDKTTKLALETTKKHLGGAKTTTISDDGKTTEKPSGGNEPSKTTKKTDDDDEGDDGEGGGKPGHHPHWCKGIRPKTPTCEARDRNSTVSIACECGLHFGAASLALQTAVGVCDSDCKTDKKNVFEYIFKGSDQPSPIAAATHGHSSMFIKCPKMENFCACNHERCCTFKEQVGFNLLQVLPHCGCKNHMFIHGTGKLECKPHDGKGNVTIFDATKQDLNNWDHEEHLSGFTSLSCLGCDRIGGKKSCVKN